MPRTPKKKPVKSLLDALPPKKPLRAEEVDEAKVRLEALELLLRRRQAYDSMEKWLEYRDAGFVPARHHKLIIEHLEQVERGELKNVMFLLPPGSAKALALDTPIPTPKGWTTMGSLSVGDEVFDERGVPCRVTWKSPVWKNRPVYKVKTDCGDVIVADEDHEWLVCLCRKHGKFSIKTTKQLYKRRSKRPMIARAGPLELPDADLPIDPYLLGLWLGDGNSTNLTITAAEEDEAFYRAELACAGIETSDRATDLRFGVLGQRAKFVSLGLLNDPWHNTFGRKHIPLQYLRASRRQRLALLQGLIDSDGSVCGRRGCSTFSNTNLELALQVQELARSLGVKATLSRGRSSIYGKDCGTYYRVAFYLANSARLPRKAHKTRNQRRTPNTYIDIEPAGIADTVCIEVDSPSHLFLCGRSMTPTHNSTYTSVEFVPWFLGRNPGAKIIAASAIVDLAESFGRRARNIVADPTFAEVFGATLSKDLQGAGNWATDKGAEYLAAGVGTGIAGRRADIGLIDDPVKSREEADSEASRRRAWEWYVNDFLPRLKPGARQIFICTRWHEDDLGGRILEREAHKWKVLKMPMLAEENDPLGRKEGELLWPEWFDEEMVERAKLDPRSWNALYQQNPVPEKGDYFRADWFGEYTADKLPKDLEIYGASDYAVTEGKGDFTELGVFGVDQNSNIYVLDWWFGKTNAETWIEEQIGLMNVHKPSRWFGEKGVIKRSIEPALLKRMQERNVFCVLEWLPTIGEKTAMARNIQARASMGKVFFPKNARWKEHVLGQVLAFPAGKHDDAVDALSLLGRGLEILADGGQPRRKISHLRVVANGWMG